ncbi:hypothetical protein BV898_07731 [Hypsibius exemplaris]|uniref:Bulb-type lectin domain-containing protein n=1 Tax=Hypsibius exemplaris TaxID=2072580 RepID=A0A1W0WSL7_HYPEX|nr:hypothetical protein BV898_07731 [Hypsibius exemplaris]
MTVYYRIASFLWLIAALTGGASAGCCQSDFSTCGSPHASCLTGSYAPDSLYFCQSGDEPVLIRACSKGECREIEGGNDVCRSKSELVGPTELDSIESEGSMPRGRIVWSNNNLTKLLLQEDGNLVLYRVDSYYKEVATWASGSNSFVVKPVSVSVLGNGEVALLNQAGEIVWKLGTAGKKNAGASLCVKDNGVICLAHNSTCIWASSGGDIGLRPNKQCKAYEWSKATDTDQKGKYRCVLLSGDLDQASAVRSTTVEVCGLTDPAVLVNLVDFNGQDWAVGCIFIKGKYVNKRNTASREDCSELCTANKSCSAYNFFVSKKICVLRLAELTPDDALMADEKSHPKGSLICVGKVSLQTPFRSVQSLQNYSYGKLSGSRSWTNGRGSDVVLYEEVPAANGWIYNRHGLSSFEWISALKMIANSVAVRALQDSSSEGACADLRVAQRLKPFTRPRQMPKK